MTRNVLIFGETGVGKSSVINMLADRHIADVSSGAAGCTFSNTAYDVVMDGEEYKLFDTTGLNEGAKGTVPPKEAIVQLYRLIRDLHEGVNLLVYVIRGPRIKETTVRNYGLFYSAFCQEKVPIIAVVTGLEDEDPMESWWDANKGEFEKYDMKFYGHACITATAGKKQRLASEYAESRVKVREVVKESCPEKGWKMATTNWFIAVVKRIYNTLASVFGWTIKSVAVSLYHALVQYGGLSPDEARKVSNEFA